MHESAGESDDTVGYHASDGRVRNVTGVVKLVEGDALKFEALSEKRLLNKRIIHDLK